MKKNDPMIKNLVGQYQNDPLGILNKLWFAGFDPNILREALAKTPNGTNDAGDILVRLLNTGRVATEDLFTLVNTQIPPGTQVPFGAQSQPNQPSLMYTEVPKPADQMAPPPPPPPSPRPSRPDRVIVTNRADSPAPSPAPKRPMTQPEVEAEIRRKYGAYAWMLDDPNFASVRKVLEDGARQGWGDQEFKASLANTDWWKNTAESVRNWDVEAKSDPTTNRQRISDNAELIRRASSTMGVALDEGTIQSMAKDMGRFNWDEPKLRAAVAAQAQYKPDYEGEIGAWETKVKGHGYNMMLPVSDEEAFSWAKKIAMGEVDSDAVMEHYRNIAKGYLPTLADQLDAGMTARELLTAQIQTTAELLEMDPEQIDFIRDPRFNAIVNYAAPDGKLRPMTMSETMKHVKSMDEYWKTTNAARETSTMVDGLARTFGKIA